MYKSHEYILSYGVNSHKTGCKDSKFSRPLCDFEQKNMSEQENFSYLGLY